MVTLLNNGTQIITDPGLFSFRMWLEKRDSNGARNYCRSSQDWVCYFNRMERYTDYTDIRKHNILDAVENMFGKATIISQCMQSCPGDQMASSLTSPRLDRVFLKYFAE